MTASAVISSSGYQKKTPGCTRQPGAKSVVGTYAVTVAAFGFG